MSSVSDSTSDSLIDSEQKMENRSLISVGIIPMAIPIIASSGTISIVISQTANDSPWSAYLGSSIAIIFFSLLLFSCLSAGEYIHKLLGKTDKRLEGFIGYIVLAIAMKMLLLGIAEVIGNDLPKLISTWN